MNSDNQSNSVESNEKNWLDRLFRNPIFSTIVVGIITATISHTLEYRLFQDSAPKDASWLGLWFILFLTFIFVISFWKACSIWLSPKRFFREDFSLHAFSGMLILILTGLLTLFSKLTPWSIFASISKAVLRDSNVVNQPNITDYMLYIFAAIALGSFASKIHSKWSGQKSCEQYRQEQKSEEIGFIEEGMNEFKRRYFRQDNSSPTLYIEQNQQRQRLKRSDFQSAVWEERAKDLVSFSSSSYAFDSISSWHDREGCWVGENVHEDTLVVLYPLNRKINQEEIGNFKNYASKISNRKGKIFGEMILAFQDEEFMDGLYFDSDLTIKTENTLLESLVDFTDYRNEIRKRVSVNTLPDVSDILLRVKDV